MRALGQIWILGNSDGDAPRFQISCSLSLDGVDVAPLLWSEVRTCGSLAGPHRRTSTIELPHRLARSAAYDAALWPGRVFRWRWRQLAKAPLAFVRREIGTHSQGQPELSKQILGGQLARVEAHALAIGLLQEFALLHHEPPQLAV